MGLPTPAKTAEYLEQAAPHDAAIKLSRLFIANKEGQYKRYWEEVLAVLLSYGIQEEDEMGYLFSRTPPTFDREDSAWLMFE